MFDVNDILAMLQNGETTESIAQKALDAVNEAARIQKQEEKDSALGDLISAAVYYFNCFDEKLADELETWWINAGDEEMNNLHSSVEGLVAMFGAITKLDNLLGEKTNFSLSVDPKKNKSDDEILTNFLSKMLG